MTLAAFIDNEGNLVVKHPNNNIIIKTDLNLGEFVLRIRWSKGSSWSGQVYPREGMTIQNITDQDIVEFVSICKRTSRFRGFTQEMWEEAKEALKVFINYLGLTVPEDMDKIV